MKVSCVRRRPQNRTTKKNIPFHSDHPHFKPQNNTLLKEAFKINNLVKFMTIQNSPEAVTTMQISTILTKVAAENKGLHSAKHP